MPDIPLNQIGWPVNVRKTFDQESILALALTIKPPGCVKQAIGVWPDGDRFVGIWGQRRYEASKLAGVPAIPCVIVEKPASDADTAEIQLLENIARENLNPVEEAVALDQIMKAKNCTASQLAVRLGLSPSQVTKALKILDLPDSIRERVGTGRDRISASAAYQLARVEDPEKQAELAARLVAGDITRDAVSNAVKKPKKSTNKTASSRVVLTLGQGRTMTLAGPALTSIDTLVSWLEELLTSCRKANKSGFGVNTLQKMLKDQAGN